MPPAATRPHVAAVRSMLTTGGLTVVDGGDGPLAAPCVVMWPAPGRPAAGSLALADDELSAEVTLVACGETSDQAMWVADRITALLNRATPTVSGRVSHPLILVDTAPVVRDDSLAHPMFSAALRWRLITAPA